MSPAAVPPTAKANSAPTEISNSSDSPPVSGRLSVDSAEALALGEALAEALELAGALELAEVLLAPASIEGTFPVPPPFVKPPVVPPPFVKLPFVPPPVVPPVEPPVVPPPGPPVVPPGPPFVVPPGPPFVVPPGPPFVVVPPGPPVVPLPVQCGFLFTALPLDVQPTTLPLLFNVLSPLWRPQGSDRGALEPP